MKPRTGVIAGLFVAVLGGAFWLLPAFWQHPPWMEKELGEQDALPPAMVWRPETATLDGKKIRWAHQEVAGVSIEESYLKRVEQKGQLIFAKSKYLDTRDLPKESDVQNQLRRADLLSVRKSVASAAHACLKPPRIETVLRHGYGQWRLTYLAGCETSDGATEFAFTPRGRLVDQRQIAARFEWEYPPVTLFPKGPSMSRLTAMNLAVSAAPFYLLTPAIEVRSDAGLSLADLHELSAVTPADPSFDMIQAYYYATEAVKWAEAKLQTRIAGLKIRTQVGYPEKRNVAFYYNKEVRIGSGDEVTFSHMAWDPTIVVHETMHSVVEALTYLPFQGEGGSLNEALADSLTALHLQTPKMGEGSYLAGPFQRSLETEVLLSEKAGKLYHDSLILSGTVWQVREDAGDEAAMDLVIHLLQHLTPSANFESTRTLVQDWFRDCSLGERCDRIGRSLNRRGWL